MTYDKDYFNWQKSLGAFGGKANIFKFEPFISRTDRVLDFGCGGGFVLENLDCAAKVGVEINDVAREFAFSRGLTVYKFVSEVPDNFATVIISNHALEHVECPLDIVKSLLPKLERGGKAVVVVPHQGPGEKYQEHDRNQHLYTWNPQTLGNLFEIAGYRHIVVSLIRHRWPPGYTKIYSILGSRAFNTLSRLYAIYKGNYQIRIVAQRP